MVAGTRTFIDVCRRAGSGGSTFLIPFLCLIPLALQRHSGGCTAWHFSANLDYFALDASVIFGRQEIAQW